MLWKLSFFQGLYKNKYLIFLDQSLLSIITFGSILALSKLASITIFSSFVVTYSYSYFIFIFCTFFLSAPILIFLSKKWQEQEGKYIFTALFLNFFLNIFFSLICFFFLKKQINEISFTLFFMLTFSMTSFDILKKFIFSSQTVHIIYGLAATIILNVIFFSTLFIYRHELSLGTILNIYWIAFFAGNFFLIASIIYKRVFIFPLSENIYVFTKHVLQVHFKYSKWIILGGIAFWGYSQGVYIFAKSLGVNDFTIGKIRTIQNLLGVFNILLISLENHYTPIFANKATQTNLIGMTAIVVRIIKENYKKVLLLFVLSIPVGLLLYEIVYGEKFGSGTVVFLLFLIIQFLLVAIRPFSIALKSIENTTPFFVSHLLAVISLIIVLPILIYFESSYTLALAILIANFVYVLYIAAHYYLRRKKQLE